MVALVSCVLSPQVPLKSGSDITPPGGPSGPALLGCGWPRHAAALWSCWHHQQSGVPALEVGSICCLCTCTARSHACYLGSILIVIHIKKNLPFVSEIFWLDCRAPGWAVPNRSVHSVPDWPYRHVTFDMEVISFESTVVTARPPMASGQWNRSAVRWPTNPKLDIAWSSAFDRIMHKSGVQDMIFHPSASFSPSTGCERWTEGETADQERKPTGFSQCGCSASSQRRRAATEPLFWSHPYWFPIDWGINNTSPASSVPLLPAQTQSSWRNPDYHNRTSIVLQ